MSFRQKEQWGSQQRSADGWERHSTLHQVRKRVRCAATIFASYQSVSSSVNKNNNDACIMRSYSNRPNHSNSPEEESSLELDQLLKRSCICNVPKQFRVDQPQIWWKGSFYGAENTHQFSNSSFNSFWRIQRLQVHQQHAVATIRSANRMKNYQ